MNNRLQKGLKPVIFPAIVSVHLVAIAAAAFTFSWWGFGAFVVLTIICTLGVTVGYHRYFTHGGFKTFPPIRCLLAIAGVLSGEAPPIYWVSYHRKHHQFSDEEGDPHSPKDGFWWSHFWWMVVKEDRQELGDMFRRYGKDMHQDKFLKLLNKSYAFWHLGLIVILAGIGWWVEGPYTATSMVVWGFFVRQVWVYHCTWAVNSATHTWGYKNYETKDDSRNLWWVAIPTAGEGWHNNHHADPASARHGHKWWEIDMSFWVIRAMELLGLVWDVKRPTKKPGREPRP